MSKSSSDKPLIENEFVFKQANQRVTKNLAYLKEVAEEDGHHKIAKNTNDPIHYYCECSDEDCRERLIFKPSEYKKLHKNERQFVILPGHEIDSIERVIKNNKSYYVVEKFTSLKAPAKKLNNTDIQNT